MVVLVNGTVLKQRVSVHYQSSSWSASGGMWVEFDCLLSAKRRGAACTLDLAESIGPLPAMGKREKLHLAQAIRDALVEALSPDIELIPFVSHVITEGSDFIRRSMVQPQQPENNVTPTGPTIVFQFITPESAQFHLNFSGSVQPTEGQFEIAGSELATIGRMLRELRIRQQLKPEVRVSGA